MTTIIVKNGNWDEARAKLKTNLDAQSIELKQKVTAALSPKSSTASPQAPVAAPHASARSAPAATGDKSILARSRLRR